MSLTANQESFARGIAEGKSYTEAYRSAYKTDRMSPEAINVEASRLKDNPKISLRIKELRDMSAKPTIMTAQKRKEWLTEVISNPEIDINARLKASDQLNRMEGEYVTKVEGDLNVTKLEDLI